ncbi:hypothetical protein TWF192_003090 [Orbilia oligospora]|uniref:Uncharacterized protein n=1 Tax=Orbilia oligospora TaxID=2813651 RepID=A0A6G1LRI3_ORBOL|nr:hypothetical protein TWF679_003453 [Orbilia oligospora]KAF3232580.1 hypothetical protein TWF192_003090 [Orbilia oligospora]
MHKHVLNQACILSFMQTPHKRETPDTQVYSPQASARMGPTPYLWISRLGYITRDVPQRGTCNVHVFWEPVKL